MAIFEEYISGHDYVIELCDPWKVIDDNTGEVVKACSGYNTAVRWALDHGYGTNQLNREELAALREKNK